MRMILTRRGAVLAVAVATAGVAAAVAWAVIPSANGVLHTCVHPASGALRAVEDAGACRGGETHVPLGGPNRGVAFNGIGDVALGPTSVAVATLDLPPGKYLVHAKANIVNRSTDPAGVFVPCSILVLGTTTSLDQTWINLEPELGYENVSRTTVALQAALHLRDKGTVQLMCAAIVGDPLSKPDALARYRQLDAIEVDRLDTTVSVS